MPRVIKRPRSIPPLIEIEAKEGGNAESTCKHEWIIETANGPVSWGECQICHERKEFRNSIPEKGTGGHRSL